MNHLQKDSYNDKISEIRARIMSKQRDREYEREGVYKYTNESSTQLKNPTKYENSLSKYRDWEKYEGRAKDYESRERDSYATRQRESIDYKGR